MYGRPLYRNQKDYGLHLARHFERSGYQEVRILEGAARQAHVISFIDQKRGGLRICILGLFSSRKAGRSVVKRGLEAKIRYGCDGLLIITNAPFSRSARYLAHKEGVGLVPHFWESSLLSEPGLLTAKKGRPSDLSWIDELEGYLAGVED